MDPKAIFRTRWPGAVLEALVKSNKILRPFDRDFSRGNSFVLASVQTKSTFFIFGKLIPCWSHFGGGSAQIDSLLVPVWWEKCLDWSPAGPMLVGKVPRLITFGQNLKSLQLNIASLKQIDKLIFWQKLQGNKGLGSKKRLLRLYRLAGLAKARPALKIQIFQTSGPKSHFQDALTRSSFRGSRQVQWNPQTIW